MFKRYRCFYKKLYLHLNVYFVIYNYVIGQIIKGVIKGASKAGSKIIKSADDVVFNQKSIDKAFGKHSADFGNYPAGKKESIELFKNDLKYFIETGTQKSGTIMGLKVLIFTTNPLNNGYLSTLIEPLILHLN